jgi:hypothetical protein
MEDWVSDRVAALLVGLCMLVSACRGDSARGDVVVDTIGGVPSVMNPVQGAFGDTVPWALQQYLVVAADQLYDRLPTVLAVDVGILPNGGVLVLDASNNRVLQFDSLGAYTGSFGQSGRGPGAFVAPFFLEVAESEVYVLDTELNRVTAFDTSGVFLRRFDVDLGGLVGTTGLFVAGGPGELYLAGEPAPFLEEAQDTGRAVLLRLDNSGAIADTVLSYAATNWTAIRRPDGGTSLVKPRFAPEPRVSAKPGTVAVTPGARYMVEVRQPDGSVLRRVTRSYENVVVTEALRDSVIEIMAQGGLPRESLAAVPFARVIPAIERVVLDDQGRLWVDPFIPDEPTRRDVFDANGRFLGAIYLPIPMRLEDVQGDRACGTVTQPSGATAVICFRIRESGVAR